MPDAIRPFIVKQVARVQRRLFAQVLGESLCLAWALGLLLATLWFLARPLALRDSSEELRWGVACGILGLSTLGGIVLATLRRPNLIASALALDERLNLKERVTTFLTLPAETVDSPVGQALAHDVQSHLDGTRIASAFPLSISWRGLLMPFSACVLAAAAFFLDPMLAGLRFPSAAVATSLPKGTLIDTTKIQEELDKLKKNVAERNQDSIPKSEELKELEKDFEKLVNQPLEKSDDKIRERVTEMRKLEDRMKERLDGVRKEAEKVEALKNHLKALGLDKENPLKEGAAKDFEEALKKGEFDKARAALEKLAKDLKNDKLDAKQQKELAEQFKKLNERMQKLMDKGDLKNQLKKDFMDGKINEEQLQKELDALQQLEDLRDIVGDLQENLGKADAKALGEKLDKAAKRFGEMELTDQEIQDLLRDQQEIRDAMRLLLDALDGEEGDGQEGNGMNGGGRPGGRRSADPNDPNSKVSPERTRVQVDAKGQQRVTGYARGGNFEKVPAKDIGGVFRQAAQEGPEAIDRQRIPEDAADIARDYFKKLGNQK